LHELLDVHTPPRFSVAVEGRDEWYAAGFVAYSTNREAAFIFFGKQAVAASTHPASDEVKSSQPIRRAPSPAPFFLNVTSLEFSS
jgi:hypothetical protein